jgi:DNA segregation ATPase FtsK/SpoIIIE, S-DNA-T family
MTKSLRTLGRSVGAFIEHRLLGGSAGDGSPVVRLKGFSAGEIPHIVDALKESSRLTLPGHDAPPAIVVGRIGQLDGVAEEHLLTDERTLTWYRNNNPHGLIIIDLDAQSDEQGLNFIDTFSDNDVFRDPESRDHRLRIIATTAWSASAATGEVPGVLLTELVDLFERLDSYWTPSLRRWVEFVVVVVSDLTCSRRAVTGPEVRASIAMHLQHLRMFPDDELFERPSATARRLGRNYHLAGLRTPQGRDVKIEDLETRIASVELLDQNREPLTEPELCDLRASMLAVLDGQKVADLGRVPLRIWEQLFERREPAVGLGAQIRDYLEQDHPTRVAEFDALEVELGLDDGDADAAEQLLRAESPDDDVALADELRGDLRRRVERLVFAGEQESPDPLRTILYGVQALDLDEVVVRCGGRCDRLVALGAAARRGRKPFESSLRLPLRSHAAERRGGFGLRARVAVRHRSGVGNHRSTLNRPGGVG